MAMPTRSARTTEFGEKAPTPATIGPGTYLGPTEPTKTRPSLAAFASSQHRSWQESAPAPAGPGPGSYGGSIFVAPSENDVRPSYCFDSKAPRLAPQYTGSTAFGKSTMVQVPGPGAYETSTSTPQGQHALRELKRSAPRSKHVCGISKRYNPPSVPRKEQSFGYDVDSQGNLLALPSPCVMRTGTRQDCAGPCDYSTYDKNWWAGVGAAKFSKGLRKTMFDSEWAAKDNRPVRKTSVCREAGPGDYNPKMKPRYHVEMPGSSPFMSSVPKCDHRLQAGPGPGQYSHDSPLGVNTSASNVPCLSSSAQRGAWLRSDQCPYNEPEAGNVPGPGAYGRLQDNSSFSTSIRKTLTDEKIGFSSTGSRTSPGPTYHTAGMPGPGQYDLDLQSIAGGLKHKSRIGCKGVFGSSGDRFRVRKRADANANKTPMQLWDQGKILKRVVVLRQAAKSSSSFKSETNRFRSHSASGASTMPPSTQYVRKDSFDDIVEKGSKSRSKPFLSTSDKREGGAFQLKEAEDIPGPGAYNVAVAKAAPPPPRSRAQTNSKLPRGARFGPAGSQSAVGPGSHDIAGSLIKRTFNITFNGAYMPAGAGRVVHSVFQAQKSGDLRKSLGVAPSDVPPRNAETEMDMDMFDPVAANEREGFPSPSTSYHVPVTA